MAEIVVFLLAGSEAEKGRATSGDRVEATRDRVAAHVPQTLKRLGRGTAGRAGQVRAVEGYLSVKAHEV